jgi:hypothetical protein
MGKARLFSRRNAMSALGGKADTGIDERGNEAARLFEREAQAGPRPSWADVRLWTKADNPT